MQRKNMIERKQNPEQKGRTILRNILITVGIMGAATIVCLALQHFSEADTHVPLLFVLAVVIVARFTEGYVYGILSAMAAVVLVNYVFTYPYFELNFSITGYPLTFVVMLATAVMVSALTTQIKWQEQIRLEVEKEKTRANLLRAVSHDLRTPLTSIYGACSAMLENYDALPRQTHIKLLSDVCADAQWLVRMVENLLSVTRVDTSTVRLSKNDTVLEELIDAVLVKFHKHYPDTEVHVEIPEEFVSIPMDAMLISQVLMNLLENAVFHAKGMENLRLRVEVKGSWAYFYVEDDGCGIPEEKLSRLFTGMLGSEAPTDQSRSSMGIGLSVCSAIIKAHGGEIWANKRAGGGTEVGFRLEMEDENGE